MEQDNNTGCSSHDCGDKEDQKINTTEAAEVTNGNAANNPDPPSVPERQEGNHPKSHSNLKRSKNQRRRQRNPLLHKIPNVPLQPLFPSRQQNQQQIYDLRNMLGRPPIDATNWWHSGRNDYHPIPAKKARVKDIASDMNNESAKTANAKSNEKAHEAKEESYRKYVIIANDYPNTLLTEEQCFEIQLLMTKEISSSFVDSGEAPKFWSCYLRQGGLVVYCADDQSKDWLVEKVPSISLEGNFQLRVGQAKDILLTTKITLFIPAFLKIEQGDIMKLLKTQNVGLRTDSWEILDCKEEEKGRSFSMAIDEESFVHIKAGNYKAHLGLTLVKFSDAQFFKLPPNVVTAAPAPAPAPAAAPAPTPAPANDQA